LWAFRASALAVLKAETAAEAVAMAVVAAVAAASLRALAADQT